MVWHQLAAAFMNRQHTTPTRTSTIHVDPSASMGEAPGLSSTAEAVVAVPSEGFLTPAGLAGVLGVSLRTLQRWDAARIGPPRRRIGNLVLYPATSLHGWLDATERLPVGRKRGGRGPSDSEHVRRR
jgi:hypothetical protein